MTEAISKWIEEEAGVDLRTMPLFVVTHVASDEVAFGGQDRFIWLIAIAIVVLAGLFYFVLVRGERKEAARMEAYRKEFRRKQRAKGLGLPPSRSDDD